ncbi:hypothetical protein [Actinomadura alba]|uniref:Amidase n=1 Tax=Actinomadura alba TaxID=406431 RepID=A0ABR7LPJ0_9ACTN|nr:hypothetical protein [Actinomadura alba]MBC6466676.1 hypothetical protein [Actinomadura alba]
MRMQRMGVPALVTPVAPSGEHHAPGVTTLGVADGDDRVALGLGRGLWEVGVPAGLW